MDEVSEVGRLIEGAFAGQTQVAPRVPVIAEVLAEAIMTGGGRGAPGEEGLPLMG